MKFDCNSAETNLLRIIGPPESPPLIWSYPNFRILPLKVWSLHLVIMSKFTPMILSRLVSTELQSNFTLQVKKKVREKSRECHNHKPRPFPDTKRKRKPTNPNKHKSNKRTKSTKISSLFPKQGNRNTKRTEKHKNKMTHGKTYNKSPHKINHKATKNKTNTGTTAFV